MHVHRSTQISQAVAHLVGHQRFDEAIDLLARAKFAALDEGLPDEAAHYSQLLATCLVAASRPEAALDAAQEAERIAEGDIGAELATIRILLFNLNRPADALAKGRRILAGLAPDDPFFYSTVALVGSAALASGDQVGAEQAFRQMTEAGVLARLAAADYPGVYDLHLVSSLVAAGLMKEEARHYLGVVLACAERHRNGTLAEYVRDLIDATGPAA